MKFILKLVADLCIYFTLTSVLMTSPFVPPVAWVVPAVIYAVYAILHYRKFVTNIKHKPVFIMYYKVFAVFSLIVFFADRQFYQTVSLPIALVFFISSVILMRLTRHEERAQRQFSYKLISSWPVIVLFAAAILLASAWFTGLLGTVVSVIYFNLVIPLLNIMMRVIVFLIVPFFNRRMVRDFVFEYNGQAPEEAYVWALLDFEREQGLITYTVLMLIIVAAAAVILMVYLLKKLLERVPALLAEDGVKQEYIPLDTNKKQRSVRQKNKLRRMYYKFLAKCRKNGIQGENYYTSETYQQLAAEKFGMDNDLKKLRDIYLPVRYGGSPEAQASKEDVDFARKLVGKLRVLKDR
ncbi:MAG: hypothetical protein FWC32_02315 [Firmicutes bacterium]|nr:hypothetical protein [Bacillota bacterium]